MAAERASVPSPTRTSMIGWLELFYDLVFVAAILVLSSAVSHLHDVSKILLVVAVFTSLWWIWLSTTLFEDRHRTDDQPQRLLVLSQMFLVAVVAMEANAGVVRDAQYLSVAYALLLLSVAAMYGRVPRRGAPSCRHRRRRGRGVPRRRVHPRSVVLRGVGCRRARRGRGGARH